MSKRYGRNQKRAARETIDRLSKECGALQGLLNAERTRTARMLQEQDALSGVIDYARKVLGNHVALPPVVRGNHPLREGGDFNALVQPKMRGFDISAGDSVMLRVQRMYQLLTGVELDDGDFNPAAVHFMVHLSDGHLAYVVSQSAIDMMDRNDLARALTPRIAEALAERLADVLKGGQKPPFTSSLSHALKRRAE